MISDIYPVMFLDGKNTYRLFMSMSENVILGKNTKAHMSQANAYCF